MKKTVELAFTFLVLLFFLFFVWMARNWPFQARLFPWVVGIPMTIIAAIRLLSLLWESKGIPSHIGGAVDYRIAQGIDGAAIKRGAIHVFSWILGFIAVIWLFGFAIAVPLIVFLHLRVQSREGWLLSLGLSAFAWLVLWELFDQIIHLPFPEGKVFMLFR